MAGVAFDESCPLQGGMARPVQKTCTALLCYLYEAVEEAICFGWIDGQAKTIDAEKYMQRYSPRKPKSPWSETNIERAKRMIGRGPMTEAGLKIFKKGVRNNLPSLP